jgi:hypothetical protein
VGRVIHHDKVAKPFTVTIASSRVRWTRNVAAIQPEAQLDGIEVIRTSETADRLTAADAVRQYKGLAHVERAFRCLQGIDIRIRPISHRTDDHVRAPMCLCLLAYDVEWHLRRAWAPVLFEDETLAHDRQTRDPVAPAQPSDAVTQKQVHRQTPDGLPVPRFDTLLAALATRCDVPCRLGSDTTTSFRQWTPLTPRQTRALALRHPDSSRTG